jgi:dTDP-4-amino-4,6-dideoxygalactose transaminase
MDKDAWKRYAASGSPHYEVLFPGFKYNMMDLQAALGIHQLRRLPSVNRDRTRHARLYHERLADVPELILPPGTAAYPADHVWHLYIPRIDLERLSIDRDAFMQALKEENIGTGLHFRAVHLHRYYRERFPQYVGRLTVTEWASERILSLPLFPHMEAGDVEDVVAAIRRIVSRCRR